MPDWLTEFFASNPSYSYVAIGTIFVLCGVGMPVPEEITLVFAGYLCFQGHADFWVMIAVSAAAILVGDLIPFVLGSLFGPRLLRLRWLRFVINRQRLATFDRWFRKRGDLVILIARFIPGLRVVAFFTAGTMRMRWGRFLVLDTCGISLTAPSFIFLGWHFGDKIRETFEWVNRIEDGILYIVLVSAVAVLVWYWLHLRAQARISSGPRDTFVEPSPMVGGTWASTSSNPTGRDTFVEPSPTVGDLSPHAGEPEPAEPARDRARDSAPGLAPGRAQEEAQEEDPDQDPDQDAEQAPEFVADPALDDDPGNGRDTGTTGPDPSG